MNLKRLCLIAGLLGLPVSYAYAANVTLEVPYELTNVPAGINTIPVQCDLLTAAGVRVGGKAMFLPGLSNSNRSIRGTLTVVFTTSVPGHSLDDATRYMCRMWSNPGQPPLNPATIFISGAIPR